MKVPDLKVGDLVRRTSDRLRLDRPTRRMAIVVGRFNALIIEVLWLGSGTPEDVNSQYLEVVNEAR